MSPSERFRQLVGICVLASIVAGVVGVIVFLASFAWPEIGVGDPHATIQAGKVTDYAINEPAFFQDGRFWLVRQMDDSFVVYSAADSFRGCTVLWRADFPFVDPRDGVRKEGWFRDPCHGSVYDLQGIKVFGPSPRDLDRFQVEVVGSQIIVRAAARHLIQGTARPDYQPFGSKEEFFHSTP